MIERALILTDTDVESRVSQITEVLRFFGVPSCDSTVGGFIAGQDTGNNNASKIRLFCSSDALWKLIQEFECNRRGIQLWGEYVHSVFVYAGNNTSVFQRVARRLTHDECTPIIQLDRRLGEWIVSDKLPQFCGVMSGLRIPVSKHADAADLGGCGSGDATTSTDLDRRTAVFSKLHYQAVPVFLSMGHKIVDIDAVIGRGNFDIREHVLSAAPLVMFVKWAFAETCWKAPEANACLVIDDPLLRPQYGFLNFQDLLDQMQHHNFSTSIAFIPWNWRRSSSEVVGLFKANPERYSLAIHGCDHTGGEFGTRDRNVLAWKARQAIDRMSRHESQTGISYDRIMVFPQGVFSEPALGVLKHTHFIAAVNTEVLCTDLNRPTIRISDVWDVAVMNYESFPLFTRRYPSQGVENFAFDILLGKPCIVVVHHDFCRDQSAHLVEFVNRLNGLNCRLFWRSLGDVVRRSCRQREVTKGHIETEMYGGELCLENHSEQRKRFRITKRESNPSAVKGIEVGSRQIRWTYSEWRIDFAIELAAGQSTTVGITFHDSFANVKGRDDVGYKVKAMLRRYLSEMRDNYIVTRRTGLP